MTGNMKGKSKSKLNENVSENLMRQKRFLKKKVEKIKVKSFSFSQRKIDEFFGENL